MTTHAPIKTEPETTLRTAIDQPRPPLSAPWMIVTLTALGIIGAIFTAWITVEKWFTKSGLFDGTALWAFLIIAAATAVFLWGALMASSRGRRI